MIMGGMIQTFRSDFLPHVNRSRGSLSVPMTTGSHREAGEVRTIIVLVTDAAHLLRRTVRFT